MAAVMDACERSAYNEMDRNCNSCKRLQRMDSPPKGKPYLLWHGRCDGSKEGHPYHPEVMQKMGYDEGVFAFHPNDWMGMKCWEPRQ